MINSYKQDGITSITPVNPELSFNEGLKQYERGNSKLARKLLMNAMKTGSDNYEAETILGYMYLYENQLYQAKALFNEAITKNPDEIPAKLGLGEILMQLDEPYQAEDCFREIVSIEPKNGKARHNLGLLYEEYGSPDRAKEQFEFGTQCGYQESRFMLGLIQIEENYLQDAVDTLLPLLKSELYQTEVRLNLGHIFLTLGEFDKSFKMLSGIEKNIDTELKSFYSSGLALMYNGQYLKAMDSLANALKMNPKYLPAKKALATCKARLQTIDRSIWSFKSETLVDHDSIHPTSIKEDPSVLSVPQRNLNEDVHVSIVICTSIDSDKLDRCIKRCLLLDYSRFEIIVLPDRKIRRKCRGVRVFPTGKVDGWMKRNFGVRVARGRLIAFIEDDAQPERDWLNASVASFINPKISAISIGQPFRNFFVRKEFFEEIKSYSLKCDNLKKLFRKSCLVYKKSDIRSFLLSFAAQLNWIPVISSIIKKFNVVISSDGDKIYAKIKPAIFKPDTDGTITQPLFQSRFGNVGLSN